MGNLKHVLVVSHFFPPMGGGGVQRVTKFVKYLESHGWRATVICGRPEDYWMRDESLLGELPASARRVPVAGASGLGLLRRLRRGRSQTSKRSSRSFGLLRRAAAWFLVPDSYVGWQPFALAAAREILRQDPPDALLSTGPPETNHLVALALRAGSGLPWLADFRDPWFALHLHPAPTAWHRRRHEKLERRVLAEADALVATTLWLRDLLRQRAPSPPARLVVIRNGYDPADFSSPAAAPGEQGPSNLAPPAGTLEGRPATPGRPAVEVATPRAQTELEPAPVLRLAHTGMLTLTRSADSLLRGMHALFERRPNLRRCVRLDLVGARESANDALVERLGLAHEVILADYVSHAEAIAVMQRADVLVLIKHLEPRFTGLIPGKLYEYLGAGRPILALVPESEAADLVRHLRCGEVVPPDDPVGIAGMIEKLYEAKTEGVLARRYRCDDTSAFRRDEQARTLAALLEQIVAARNAPPSSRAKSGRALE